MNDKLKSALEARAAKCSSEFEPFDFGNRDDEQLYAFKYGAASNIDLILMLVESLDEIARNDIGPPYEFSCEDMQTEATETLAKLYETLGVKE